MDIAVAVMTGVLVFWLIEFGEPLKEILLKEYCCDNCSSERIKGMRIGLLGLMLSFLAPGLALLTHNSQFYWLLFVGVPIMGIGGGICFLLYAAHFDGW